MRDSDAMFLPMCAAPSPVWSSEGASSLPRGSDAMSPMRLSDRKAVCMWKDDGQQYPLFAGKGFLWQAMWASPRMWVPSMRTTMPCRCLCPMYDHLRKTAEALVSSYFVNSRRNFWSLLRRFQSSSTTPMHSPLSCPVRLSRSRAVQRNNHGHLSMWSYIATRGVWAEDFKLSWARGFPCPILYERVRDSEAQRSSRRGAWHQS